MSINKTLASVILLLSCAIVNAQVPLREMSSSEIELSLRKLDVVGSVLYVAAHPDDENTSLLAYFANEKMLKTSYLSMTRGDGGQNLIGKEIREQLGVIRTQELLAARRIDGAEQYFTRANDFGFSKNPEETLQKWNREQVLSDVVWIIRKTRPDVILTRFPTTGEGGHGHHTSSAILAEEAFKAAADPKQFPDQLKWVKVWQPKAIYWNTWQSDKGLLIDIGTYNPLLGKSYNEISADSRSMHKSQGFGVARSRGTRIDYANFLAGQKPEKDLFENIDLSWKRVKGSDEFSNILKNIIQTFNHSNPSASIPQLVKAYKALNKVSDEFWKKEKSEELKRIILACAGIYYETTANAFQTTPGSAVDVSAFIVNRSPIPVQVKSIQYFDGKSDSLVNKILSNNTPLQLKSKITIPETSEYSQDYWLEEPYSEGLYTVKDQLLVGVPETKSSLISRFTLEILNETFTLESPVLYKWTDPVFGEKYRKVIIVPEVTAVLTDKVYLFSGSQSKVVDVILTSETADAAGELQLQLPSGWSAEPASLPFDFKEKNQQNTFSFIVKAGSNAQSGEVKAQIKIGGKTLSKSKITIDYDHIPVQTLLPEASAKLVKTELEIAGKTVGYIEGAGDDIPSILKQMGYEVVTITDQQLKDAGALSRFDAIIAGIRAYNTNEQLKVTHANLMKYVSEGGNLIVQYNTNQRLILENFAPYPLTISRDRVTVEESPVKLTNENHSVLNFPNKITSKDFEGWVQERGLYFPSKWDSRYQTVISTQDPGEKELEGGILVSNYGKGSYIYTSLSWFRQLPEGVPGAIRLFSNLVSYGRDMKSDKIK